MQREELPREERMQLTSDLFRRMVEGPEADEKAIRDEIIVINRCVAESIARSYNGRGIAADDLRQVAYEGLVKAVHRFRPEEGKDLLSFAVPTIRGEIRKHFRDLGWTVRPPRRLQELQQRINRVSEDLSHRLGRDPEVDEIIESAQIDRSEYDEALQAFGCFRTTSLDQPVAGAEGRSVADSVVDDDTEVSASEARLTLEPVVRELPARDRRILYLRFYEDRTQAEIGEELGVTQMQVSRLLTGIFGRLREAVGEEH